MKDWRGLLADKGLKALARRQALMAIIKSDGLPLAEAAQLPGKQLALVLEAMEAISNKEPQSADVAWLPFAASQLQASHPGVKREAARIIGNLAARFPDEAGSAIPALISNAGLPGTVLRWSAAYALARILATPQHALGPLYEQVEGLADREQDNGVKNQYLAGLKKADRIRKKAATGP